MNTNPDFRTPEFGAQGRLADSLFRYATIAAGAIVLLVLGAVAFTTTKRAWPALDSMGRVIHT